MAPDVNAPISTMEQASRPMQMEPVRLPTSIVSMGDARRLRRDLAALEETLQAIRLRTNAPVAKLPRLSRSLEEFASTNRLNFLLPDDRHHAVVFMDYVLRKAPVLKISFASEATRKFTTEILVWLRTNFDSEMLIEIGLEPGIAAGCVVRTQNKVFDFSLIKHLAEKRPMLMEKIFSSSTKQVVQLATPPDTSVTATTAAPVAPAQVATQPVVQVAAQPVTLPPEVPPVQTPSVISQPSIPSAPQPVAPPVEVQQPVVTNVSPQAEMAVPMEPNHD